MIRVRSELTTDEILKVKTCLDYRSCGKAVMPAVTYIDVCTTPTEVTIGAQSVDFVAALADARTKETGAQHFKDTRAEGPIHPLPGS